MEKEAAAPSGGGVVVVANAHWNEAEPSPVMIWDGSDCHLPVLDSPQAQR